MAFNFRMILSGLLAVVPDRRFDKSIEAAGSVTVLLPNLLVAKTLSTGEPLDPHQPLLEFATKDRHASSSRTTDFEHIPTKRGVCVIAGEEIELLPVPFMTTSFKIVGGKPKRVNAPGALERQSLFWLATMEEAAPGQRLKPGLLDGPVGPQRDIVARLKLARGRLATHELSELVCTFKPAMAEPFKRQVAVSLVLAIDNVPKQVEFALKRQGQEATKLVFAPPDGVSEVEVRLVNRELDNLFGFPQGMLPIRTTADFEVFHALVDGPTSAPKPFLEQHLRPGDSGVRTIHALCPPTGLNI